MTSSWSLIFNEFCRQSTDYIKKKFKFFKNKNTPKKLKLRLKNTTIDKTLTYASETGTLTDRDREQLNSKILYYAKHAQIYIFHIYIHVARMVEERGVYRVLVGKP